MRIKESVGIGLAATLALSGCSAGANVVKAAAETPIAPIVLKIVHNGLVAVAEDDPEPMTKVLALIGVFVAGEVSSAVAAEQQKEKTDATDATLLLINQTVGSKQMTSVFRVTTNHKLVVAMNGKFVETIEPHEITINTVPGTDSTIVVTDADAGQLPYIAGTVHMNPSNFANNVLGDHSHVDLDTGEDKNLGPDAAKKADLFDSATGGVVTVNGTAAAHWTSTDTPTLAGCESLPTVAWTTKMYGMGANLGGPGGDVWCVRSKQGRYGTLAGGSENIDYSWTFDYVLWKKPGDK